MSRANFCFLGGWNASLFVRAVIMVGMVRFGLELVVGLKSPLGSSIQGNGQRTGMSTPTITALMNKGGGGVEHFHQNSLAPFITCELFNI